MSHCFLNKRFLSKAMDANKNKDNEEKGTRDGSALDIQVEIGYLQPTIVLSMGTPMEELGKGLKELKGFVTPQEEQQYQSTRHPPPIAPRD